LPLSIADLSGQTSLFRDFVPSSFCNHSQVEADRQKAEGEVKKSEAALTEAQELQSWWKDEASIGTTPGAAGGDGDDEDDATEERGQLKEAKQKAAAIGFCAKMLLQLIKNKTEPQQPESGQGWA
jgi:hypothetical protein